MNKGLEALENIKGNCDLFDEGYQWDNEFSKQFDSDIDSIENELNALEVVKALFQGRCKLYERTEYIETCNEEGCHAEKIATTSYILEFHNYDLHYEFHLHKDEFDLLKEVML